MLLTAHFTTLVFIIDTLIVAAALAVFFVIICLAAGLPLQKIFSHWKMLLFLILFVLILQTFFGNKTEDALFASSPLIPASIPLFGGLGYVKGIFTGLMISSRIIALAVLMPLLIISTEYRLLSYGISRLGFNYQAAFIITSVLNIVPSLQDSIQKIINARRMRGSKAFENKNIFRRLREYAVISVPLLIKIFRRSSMLGLAMDARAFGAYKKRTWILSTKFAFIDYAAFVSGLLIAGGALTANVFLKG